MDVEVRSARMSTLIVSYYPKAGLNGGCGSMPVEAKLGVYFLQTKCALSDSLTEETLYDLDAMRRFDSFPYEQTVQQVPHLETHLLFGKD